MKEGVSWLHYDWHFKLADAFPLVRCLEAVKDPEGRNFFEESYEEDLGGGGTTSVLPFNDKDLFVAPIEDAGSRQSVPLPAIEEIDEAGRKPDRKEGIPGI